MLYVFIEYSSKQSGDNKSYETIEIIDNKIQNIHWVVKIIMIANRACSPLENT